MIFVKLQPADVDLDPIWFLPLSFNIATSNYSIQNNFSSTGRRPEKLGYQEEKWHHTTSVAVKYSFDHLSMSPT